jgi:hypothetical protein
MRHCSIPYFLMFSLVGTAPSYAQPATDVPLTREAFNRLTAEQAANRLIGSSAQLVSKMLIGLPPGYAGGPLSLVRFFTKPRAVEPGLCRRDEIDVRFETADGSPMGSANASTLMKISGLTSGRGFAVVGDLAAPFDQQQRLVVEEKCSRLDNPLSFFPAASEIQAWEAAYLVETALKEAQARSRQQLDFTCNTTKCDNAYESLQKLSPNHAFDVAVGCRHPPDGLSVCYTIRLSDPLDYYRSWLLYIESTHRVGVGRGPAVTFKTVTFTIDPEPVI